MFNYLITIGVFVLLTASLYVGRQIVSRLPLHHMDADTKEAVKRAVSLLTTLTALVLGLLISNAKGSFDRQTEVVSSISARIAVLDQVLAHYGPEAAGVRSQFRRSVENVMLSLWTQTKSVDDFAPEVRRTNESFLEGLLALRPTDQREMHLKDRAVSLADSIVYDRFYLATFHHRAIPPHLLGLVICWLTVIFAGLGFCSARGTPGTIFELFGAACVAGAILLLLDFDHPFEGWVQVSRYPIDVALEALVRK